MYLDFLKRLVTLLEAANASNENSVTPTGSDIFTNDIPVLFDGDLQGFLRDEIGGEYNYVPATDAERDWWEARPWAPKKMIQAKRRPWTTEPEAPCPACGATNSQDRVFCRQCGHKLSTPAPSQSEILRLAEGTTGLTLPDTRV